MKCPFYEMSHIWNVPSRKCPIYEMSHLGNVLSMKCTIYEMSHLWNVLSMKCPSYEMSYLWNVLSMKCPIYEMSYLWNVPKLYLKYSMSQWRDCIEGRMSDSQQTVLLSWMCEKFITLSMKIYYSYSWFLCIRNLETYGTVLQMQWKKFLK